MHSLTDARTPSGPIAGPTRHEGEFCRCSNSRLDILPGTVLGDPLRRRACESSSPLPNATAHKGVVIGAMAFVLGRRCGRPSASRQRERRLSLRCETRRPRATSWSVARGASLAVSGGALPRCPCAQAEATSSDDCCRSTGNVLTDQSTATAWFGQARRRAPRSHRETCSSDSARNRSRRARR